MARSGFLSVKVHRKDKKLFLTNNQTNMDATIKKTLDKNIE